MNGVNTILDAIKESVRSVMRHVARGLNTLSGGRITPNAVTLMGLAGHVLIAWLIISAHPLRSAVLLVFFGLFDTLDGELARLQHRDSTAGMLLDSVTDRAKEVLLYTGIAYVISGSERPLMTAWAAAACGVSLLVSYVNAWGEAVATRMHLDDHKTNKAFRTGFMTFEVRMATIFVGLVSGRLILAVVVITIGGGLTAVYRLVKISARLT